MLAIELWCCCNQQGKPNALNEFCDSGQAMIMSKHNHHHFVALIPDTSNRQLNETC